MQEQEERIERLGETILREAEKTANDIVSSAEAEAKEIIKSAYDSYMRDEEEQLKKDKNDTRILYQKEVSKRDFSAHKEVLAHRSKLVEDFFTDIKKRLSDFTKTTEYKDFLAKSLDCINKEKAISKDEIIYISRNDVAFKNELAEKYSVQVIEDKNIVIGGVRVFYPNENIYMDKTLDDALLAEKNEFVNHIELQL